MKALDALNLWIKFAIRTPNGPLTDAQIPGGVPAEASPGPPPVRAAAVHELPQRRAVEHQRRDFAPPPALADIFCERNVANPALPTARPTR